MINEINNINLTLTTFIRIFHYLWYYAMYLDLQFQKSEVKFLWKPFIVQYISPCYSLLQNALISDVGPIPHKPGWFQSNCTHRHQCLKSLKQNMIFTCFSHPKVGNRVIAKRITHLAIYLDNSKYVSKRESFQGYFLRIPKTKSW